MKINKLIIQNKSKKYVKHVKSVLNRKFFKYFMKIKYYQLNENKQQQKSLFLLIVLISGIYMTPE